MNSINISKVSMIINNLQVERNWSRITYEQMALTRDKIMSKVLGRKYDSFILLQFEKLEAQNGYDFKKVEYKIGDKIDVHFMDIKPCIITDFSIKLNFVTWNIDVDIIVKTDYIGGYNKIFKINEENTKISKRF